MSHADSEERIEDELEPLLVTWDVNTRLPITSAQGEVLDASKFFTARTASQPVPNSLLPSPPVTP